MLAITISEFGGPEVLKLAEVPDPQPRTGELRIRVHAAGVARADTLQRRGKYAPPPGVSAIPGLDIAGVVDAVGPEVDGFNEGDPVCAILAGGGYAELCTVPAQQVLPIPQNWSFIEAATLPENLFTVYDNIVTRAALREGETILIHGGSSGIGTMAIMLARATGAVPIVTAGSAEKCSACVQIGAAHAINYKEHDFVTELQRLQADGVDVVLDMVGGPYLNRNLACLAAEGRIMIIAVQGGASGDLDIGRLMQKRARILGSTMRARSPEQKGAVATALLKHVWPSLPAKSPIRPIIDRTFPLSHAAEAHARMEEGSHIGKIVLVTR